MSACATAAVHNSAASDNVFNERRRDFMIALLEKWMVAGGAGDCSSRAHFN
jgi:hypothetical protein